MLIISDQVEVTVVVLEVDVLLGGGGLFEDLVVLAREVTVQACEEGLGF